MKKGAGSVPEHLKLSKEAAGYSVLPRGMRPPPGVGVQCGTCRFGYRPRGSEVGGCLVVEGVIARHGWCRLWTNSGLEALDFYSGRHLSDLMARLEPYLKRIFADGRK
jgi:hypothetical protein